MAAFTNPTLFQGKSISLYKKSHIMFDTIIRSTIKNNKFAAKMKKKQKKTKNTRQA